VADFDDQMLRLAHRKERPAKLRARHVLLSPDGIEFFKEQSRDKLPGAPLFTEDGETPWRRHIWAREMPMLSSQQPWVRAMLGCPESTPSRSLEQT
jgi:hypothetical protein